MNRFLRTLWHRWLEWVDDPACGRCYGRKYVEGAFGVHMLCPTCGGDGKIQR